MEEIAEACITSLKSPVFLHNSETQTGSDRSVIERYGMTPTADHGENLACMSMAGGGYHCVYFDDADFEIFQKHQYDRGYQSGIQPEAGKRYLLR